MSIKTKTEKLNFTKLEDEEILQRADSLLELMSKRRTVREYADTPIPDGLLEKLIQTAGTAPSGANKQPWHFCVVTNPDLKRKIRESAEIEEKENYERRFSASFKEDLAKFETTFQKEYIDHAPALIIVFKERYQMENGVRRKNYYVNESVGIAIGFLITAIHNAGLVTLPHTPNPMSFLNDLLERPKNETPLLLMPVGFPKQDTEVPVLNRKPLEEIMHVYD